MYSSFRWRNARCDSQYCRVEAWQRTYLSSSILRGTLAGGKLPTALPPFTVVAGVGLAHVVLLRAGDGWVDVLLGTAGMCGLLLDRRGRTGLSSAGSKEMFS